MWTTYWWTVTDLNSDLCGEEFFTELQDGTYKDHKNYAKNLFPDIKLHCFGQVTKFEAECMGLDTY